MVPSIARTDPDAPAEAVSQGTLRTADGSALPLESTEVVATVTGPLADVVVRQRFRNDRAEAIEAVYCFPLPEEASVHTLRFRLEDRVIQGVVKEKAHARRDYEAALAQGRAATLLEEDQPTLFTLSVANLAPGAVIDVELGYQDLLPYDDGRWRFTFPMVAPTTYREGPPTPTGALPSPRTKTEERAADVSLSVRFPPDAPVSELRAVSHLVALEDHPAEGQRVRLRAEGSLANRDFVLEWRASEQGVRPWLFLERKPSARGTFLLVLTPSAPRATTERGGGEGDLKTVRCGNCGGAVRDLTAIRDIPGLGPVFPCGYCGAVLTPGTDVITRPSRPRDVIVLVDRSASMRGAEARVEAAVQHLLKGLAPGDAVQLRVFDHESLTFDPDPSRFIVLSPELASHASRFLAEHPPRGGSDLEGALQACGAVTVREGRTRVVVLVSDVAVGNEGRLLRRVPELLGPRARLFVLAVGASVERRLASRLARVGAGVCEVVPPGPLSQEALDRFARRVREAGPVLTDLQLWWEGAGSTELLPTPLPDLYGGEAIRALGRFTGEGPTTLVLTGLTAEGRAFRQELAVTLPSQSAQAPGLERAWARRKVLSLAERAEREPDHEALAREGLELSLAWSLVGKWTSLVAEDRVVSVAKRRARQAVLVNRSLGIRFVLDGARKVVGRRHARNETADTLFLDDPKVSRNHAELTFNGQDFVLRDLASTNGTQVDGRNVREAVLRAPSEVRFGSTALTFELMPEGSPGAWFEFIPTERAVDASTGVGNPSVASGYGREPPPARHTGRSFAPPPDLDPAPVSPFGPPPSPAGPPPLARPGAFGVAQGGPPPMPGAPFGGPPPGDAYGAPPAPPPPPMMPPPMMAPPVMALAAKPPPMPVPAMPAGGPPPMGGPRMPALGGAPPPTRAPAPPPMAPGGPPPMAPGGPSPMAGGGPPPMRAPAPMPPMSVPKVPVAPPTPASPMPCLSVAPMPPPGTLHSPPSPPPRPVYCARCGQENLGLVRYCIACGTDLMPPLAPAVAGPRARVPLRAPESEPYPEQELQWLQGRIRGEFDLAFLVDATGSMGPYLAEVQDRLLELCDALKSSPLCRSLRLALVAYRDHPPQERTFVTQVTPFTESQERVREAVLNLTASGGGDGPEAVTDGLFEVVKLDWRPGAAKAVAWFGDAPPHGVEPAYDQFASGCPCGRHWFAQAESCREMGVAVYALGCLPGIRDFVGAEQVYRTVARTTRGAYLPLREASLLVPLIGGAAECALDGQRLDAFLEALLAHHANTLAPADPTERVRWITEAFRRENVRARAMDADAESATRFPLRFRPVTPTDIRASLERLRAAGYDLETLRRPVAR